MTQNNEKNIGKTCVQLAEEKVLAVEVHLNTLRHELDGALAHDPDAVPAIEEAINHALRELAKAKASADPLGNIGEGVDAVFLPGKLHGCEDEVYIIWLNPQACDGKGSWDIAIIDYERILELYEHVGGDAEQFFAILPDWFHGEWCYCDAGNEHFDSYTEAYFDADFMVGRDGGEYEEMMFLVKWAQGRANPAQNNPKVRMVIDFNVNEEMLKEKNLTATEVVNSIEFHDHDSIDGFEIYPSIDGCDLCSDFFLCNPRVISKEIVAETNIPSLIYRVRALNSIANGRDADTVLYDTVENADFEISGLTEAIFRTWESSTDKKAVEELFYTFTDMQLEDFLEKCIKEILQEE